jgi:hypothetical protein
MKISFDVYLIWSDSTIYNDATMQFIKSFGTENEAVGFISNQKRADYIIHKVYHV